MSTDIGTLQPKVRLGRSFWAVVFALLTVAAIVVFVDPTERGAGREAPAVSGTAANTPTELSGGIIQSRVSGTAANTPTELSGGIIQSTAAETAPLDPRLERAEREIAGDYVGGAAGASQGEPTWDPRLLP